MRKNTFDFIVKRFVLIIMLIFPCALLSESFSGKCVSVSDGDTISVLKYGRAIKIRIDGIDCPEMGQDFGRKAKQFTSDLVIGKIVEVDSKGLDKSGTTFAVVFVEKKDVGFELIKAGLAWNYTQYSSDPIYALAEQEAKNAQIGLWSMTNPISPWDFRLNSFKIINDKSPNSLSIPSAKVPPLIVKNGNSQLKTTDIIPTKSPEGENSKDSINVIDALKKGNISEITVEGSEKSIKINIVKSNKEDALNIIIPSGLTTFGFISRGEIKNIRIASEKTYNSEGITLNFRSYVGTDDFNGDGFSIEMDKNFLITIPKNKGDMMVSAEGKLKVNVPMGYSGFALSGVSGRIISGHISISKNTFTEKDAAKFNIGFGSMKIRK